jgi:hypothetical protein
MCEPASLLVSRYTRSRDRPRRPIAAADLGDQLRDVAMVIVALSKRGLAYCSGPPRGWRWAAQLRTMRKLVRGAAASVAASRSMRKRPVRGSMV